jgi:hypothetical protein
MARSIHTLSVVLSAFDWLAHGPSTVARITKAGVASVFRLCRRCCASPRPVLYEHARELARRAAFRGVEALAATSQCVNGNRKPLGVSTERLASSGGVNWRKLNLLLRGLPASFASAALALPPC